MKKSLWYLCLLLVVTIFTGCSGEDKQTVDFKEHPQNYVVIGNIFFPWYRGNDGCQYIWFPNAYGGSFSHKGSCDNPIHKK